MQSVNSLVRLSTVLRLQRLGCSKLHSIVLSIGHDWLVDADR